MDQISTKDIFRAAYHLSLSDRFLSVSFDENGQKRFTIKGETLQSDDIRYCTGKAQVNPLVFEKSYRFLEEIAPQIILDLQMDFLGLSNNNSNKKIEPGEMEPEESDLLELEEETVDLLVDIDEAES